MVGAGQLYNRQLGRAFYLAVCFYLVGGGLLAGYIWVLKAHPDLRDHDPPAWTPQRLYPNLPAAEQHRLRQLRRQVAVVIHTQGEPFTLKEQLPVWRMCGQTFFGCLWLFAIVDAFLWAQRLRSGRWVIRMSWGQQWRRLPMRWLPIIGYKAPRETVTATEWTRVSMGLPPPPRTGSLIGFLFVILGFLIPFLLRWLGMGLILAGILLAWPAYVVWGTWLLLAELFVLLWP